VLEVYTMGVISFNFSLLFLRLKNHVFTCTTKLFLSSLPYVQCTVPLHQLPTSQFKESSSSLEGHQPTFQASHHRSQDPKCLSPLLACIQDAYVSRCYRYPRHTRQVGEFCGLARRPANRLISVGREQWR
jgi:hypothetical protein